MDKSSSEMARLLLGKFQKNVSQISGDAWLIVIEELYRDFRVVENEIPGLFNTIAALMNMEDSELRSKVKHGVTVFSAKGVGINTAVKAARFYKHGTGHHLFPAESGWNTMSQVTQRHLLLLRPTLGCPLRWAQWEVKYRQKRIHPVPEAPRSVPFHSEAVASSISKIDTEVVAQIFESNPGAASKFIDDLWSTLHLHLNAMRKSEQQLSPVCAHVLAVRHRYLFAND